MGQQSEGRHLFVEHSLCDVREGQALKLSGSRLAVLAQERRRRPVHLDLEAEDGGCSTLKDAPGARVTLRKKGRESGLSLPLRTGTPCQVRRRVLRPMGPQHTERRTVNAVCRSVMEIPLHPARRARRVDPGPSGRVRPVGRSAPAPRVRLDVVYRRREKVMLALRLIGRSFDVVEGPTVFGVWEQPQAMNSQRFRARSALLYSPGCLPALVIFMNPRLFASRPTRRVWCISRRPDGPGGISWTTGQIPRPADITHRSTSTKEEI